MRSVSGIAFVACGVGLLLTQLGYSFEDGDQLQYLLLPYRWIDPRFVEGDWFTWQTTHYHQTFGWLIWGLYHVFGNALPEAVFGCHLMVLAGVAYGTLRLAHAWGFGMAAAATALLLSSVIRPAAIGGAVLSHGQLLPADMAMPALLLAFAAWLEDRPLRTGLWLGLSGMLHANFAVLGALVLLPLEAMAALRARRVRMLITMGAAFVALALPSLYTILRSFLVGDSAPEAVRFALAVRSPHHYQLAAMPPEDFAWPALLAIAGMPLWLNGSWAADRTRKRQLLAALLLLLTVGLIGSVIQILPIIRLFVWRLSVPLLVILSFVAAETARRAWQARDVLAGGWLMGCLAVAATFVRVDLARVMAWGPPLLFALPALVPLTIAGAVLHRRQVARWLVPLALIVPLAWTARVAATPRAPRVELGETGLPELRGPRLAPIEVSPKLHKGFRWIRSETPQDARFLIPPSMIGFRLQSRRAVYVDWKCIPMKGEEVLEWRRRFFDVLGVRKLPATGYLLRRRSEDIYRKRDPAELVALARREHLTHLLIYKNAAVDPLLNLERGPVVGMYRIFTIRHGPLRTETNPGPRMPAPPR